MSKLGKHIYEQAFNVDLNIDQNYAIFPDTFTFAGVPGFTAFGGTPSIQDFWYDYSSITHWSDVRDVLTASCIFVRDEINDLYIATGGSGSYSGLTFSDQEALSKNFLIPKNERDLIHTQQQQEDFAAELYICTNEVYEDEALKNAVNYISTSDDGDIQNYLENPGNFQGGGGGSVSSVNGQSGNVVLDLTDLGDVNTSGVGVNHALIYDGVDWVTDLRAPFSIHPDSQNYMNYNETTGELFLEQLAITDVTVIDSVTNSSDYFNSPINCDSHEEGDTVVFPNTTDGVEVWMHNGGSDLTIADYIQIENPSVSDSYVRSVLSAEAPIYYDNLTGVISITQSGKTSDGYLSQTDYNYFNNKVDTVNGKVGTVILTTSDIVEGTNKYYCTECAWDDFNSGTGLGFNRANGTYYALINDSATNSNTELWSAGKIHQEILLAGGGTSSVGGTGTAGYLSVWNSTNSLNDSIIQDDGTSIGIGITPVSNRRLYVSTTDVLINTNLLTSYTGASEAYGLLVQGSGTSTNRKFGILASMNGATQNIGMFGATVNTSSVYPTTHDIGVVGQARHTTRGNIGIAGVTPQSSTGDNIAGYFEASNAGTGNAYVLQLIDGLEGDGKVLTSDSNGYASWQDPILGTGASSSVVSVNGYTGTVNLVMNDLTDVDTVSVTASRYDLLSWDGFNWVPTTPELATKKTWTWGGASNKNTTDRHLYKSNDTPTNISPFIAFKDCKILNMSAANTGNETWVAETRVNGVVAASMSITETSSAWSSFDVDVNAGDKISFYCNGTSIDSPSIEILLQEI